MISVLVRQLGEHVGLFSMSVMAEGYRSGNAW
ncbi:MAG: hypothetical protein FD169_1794 [Bacillota bacterium]|nr:MAG: hypothetical protein FD169_1794 [Bacillota bacterium]